MPIIIGTAGHIDHGKSSLVKSLTGTDPDRLSEEQERGMTIDLGFAFLNENIAFIDVPGHERFIKNMVAGVSTIDLAMLVIAADDGIMPQTREHLDILSLLQLRQGLIVLTKIDLVDAELLQLLHQEVQDAVKGTFLEKAPLFEVSTITGKGIEDLRSALIKMAEKSSERLDRGVFWLPVDRSFTMKGFGTVVTGSVISGQIAVGDTVEILPAGKVVKVRGLQSHGKPSTRVYLGQRAALNLQNIGREEIGRGDVLAAPDQFKPSQLFDARMQLLKNYKKELQHRSRVRVHIGTREIMARIKILDAEKLAPGKSALVQIELELAAVALRRDPFVIRQYSPPITIGGGIILNTNPKPHRRFTAAVIAELKALEHPDPSELVLAALISKPDQLTSVTDLQNASGLATDQVLALLEKNDKITKFVISGKPHFIHAQNIAKIKNRLLSVLVDFHQREPLKPGMSKAELRAQYGGAFPAKLFDTVLENLADDRSIEIQPHWVKLAGHAIRLSPAEEELAQKILQALDQQHFSPPDLETLAKQLNLPSTAVQHLLTALMGMGKILRFEGDIYFIQNAIDAAHEFLQKFAAQKKEISVSEFREGLGTSRKYAMALLSYFDQKGITERVGDGRVIATK